MKRKIFAVLLLLLCGCQNAASLKGESVSSAKLSDTLEAEVISLKDDSILVATDQSLALIRIENDDADKYKVGNIVQIAYEEIQETFPLQFINAELSLIEQGDERVDMILEIIKTLYETDPGLNSEINFIALNFSQFDFLSERQKQALCYLAENELGLQTIQATLEELIDQGLAENVYIPEGILIQFSCDTENAKNNTLTFNCMKYRSGIGAIFFSDSTATCKNGKWNYRLGYMSVS